MVRHYPIALGIYIITYEKPSGRYVRKNGRKGKNGW
jgi:hypothetical protein